MSSLACLACAARSLHPRLRTRPGRGGPGIERADAHARGCVRTRGQSTSGRQGWKHNIPRSARSGISMSNQPRGHTFSEQVARHGSKITGLAVCHFAGDCLCLISECRRTTSCVAHGYGIVNRARNVCRWLGRSNSRWTSSLSFLPKRAHRVTLLGSCVVSNPFGSEIPTRLLIR